MRITTRIKDSRTFCRPWQFRHAGHPVLIGKNKIRENIRKIYKKFFCGKLTPKGLKATRAINLIEIMVVLLIIGLLGTFVFMNLMPTVADAKIKTAMTQMGIFENVLTMYKMDNGSYPTTQQGLQALVQMPNTEPLPSNYQTGGYLSRSRVPKDPWHNDYVYEFPDPDNPGRFLLKSMGDDGREGGEGNGKDIYLGR